MQACVRRVLHAAMKTTSSSPFTRKGTKPRKVIGSAPFTFVFASWHSSPPPTSTPFSPHVHPTHTSRLFRCDCGTPGRLPGSCKLKPPPAEDNVQNRYNHNFVGRYCSCDGTYDPDNDIMCQCIACEDWFHIDVGRTTCPGRASSAHAGASPTGASPTGGSPTGASPTGASLTAASPARPRCQQAARTSTLQTSQMRPEPSSFVERTSARRKSPALPPAAGPAVASHPPLPHPTLRQMRGPLRASARALRRSSHQQHAATRPGCGRACCSTARKPSILPARGGNARRCKPSANREGRVVCRTP